MAVPICNFKKIFEMLMKKAPPDEITTTTSQVSVPSSVESISKLRKNDLTSDSAEKSSITTPDEKSSKASSENKPTTSRTNRSSSNSLTEIIAQTSANPLRSKIDVYRLFVHGKYLTLPLEQRKEALFTKEIHEGLDKLNFRAIFRTQAHCWPNILDKRSVCIVNGEQSGKTFSYLPALLSLLAESESAESSSALGPRALIIVPSSKDVERIAGYCSALVSRDALKVIKAFGKWNSEQKKIDIVNGCDLLITTPPCFARMSHASGVIRLFNKKRIKRCVFDGIDSMLEKFDKEIKLIIKTCTSGEQNSELNPQLIITSSSWIERIRPLLKLVCDPIVVIGSFAEAALYSKCFFQISKKSHEGKLEELAAVLKQLKWRTKKMLIVTNRDEEINILTDFMMTNEFRFKVIDAKMTPVDSELTHKRWIKEEEGSMKILITCDEALIRCKISEVEELIHFSLPNSWSRFNSRFATLSNNLMSFAEQKTKDRCITRIMLNEENTLEVPRLIDFLKTRQVVKEIPEEINELVQRIIQEREEHKFEARFQLIAPICSNTLRFGQCQKAAQCDKRHIFSEFDKPVNIPCDGFIKFELLAIRDPTVFVIKIREYLPRREKNWINREKMIKKSEDMLEAMQTYMNDNRIIEANVVTGEMYAVFCTTKLKWCRCKVLEKQNNAKKPSKAIIFLLDYGNKLIVLLTDIYMLPASIKLLDPSVVELRIANLIPFDNDEQWDRESRLEIEKIINKEKTSESYNFAEISFSVQNTIVAESFDIRNPLKGIATDIIKFSLKPFMLKNEFCLKNESVLTSLKLLMDRAKLYYPKKIERTTVNNIETDQEEKSDPRWKNLAVKGEYQVFMLDFESPDMFYVRLDDKDNKVLKSLMKPVENCEERIPMKDLADGNFCLVAKEGEKTKRGLILSTNVIINVFLLDYGKAIKCFVNEIFQLPVSLINAAPFQAAQCRWIGVKPRFSDEWEGRALRAIKKFVLALTEKKLIKLRVAAHSGNIYDVVLFNPETGKRLDELVIDEGYADVDEDFVETIDELFRDDDKDEEGELEEEPQNKENVANETAEEIMNEIFSSKDVDCRLKLSDLLNVPETSRFVPPGKLPGRPRQPKDSLKSVKAEKEKPLVKASNHQPTTIQPTTLNYIHKHPKIVWRQNEISVFLTVAATDHIDYGLNVTESSMKIRIQYDREQFEYTEIFFYSVINKNIISHEHVGQNIIVRLVKCLPLDWPRLTKLNETNRFIKYNAEPIDYSLMDSETTEIKAVPDEEECDNELNELQELSDDDNLDF